MWAYRFSSAPKRLQRKSDASPFLAEEEEWSAHRMLSCPLRKNQYACNHQYNQCAGSGVAAQIEAALRQGLIQKIADHCAQRPRQNERRPKESSLRYLCPEMAGRHEKQKRAEDQRPTAIPKPRAIRGPVAERSTEGLGKHDRDPVKGFDLGRTDGGDRY